jgi:hypothetical protein
VKHVLVVANQTLGGKDLLDAIAARMEQEPCQFVLLVPAAPPESANRSFADVLIGAPTGVEDHESGIAAAHQRLDQGLASLREMGATADGWVGPNDPVAAIRDVLKHRQFDEIIVSTLPVGASRWLRRDVPHRVERAFRLPVTVITARSTTA